MKVLLVGPDLEENLSLRYLASSLRQAGHTPRIATFDSAEDAASVIAAAAGSDLVALSMCYQVRAAEFLSLARALKDLRPDRPVVAGGHFASCAGRELLLHHPELDVIAVHEGERTLAELASLDRMTPETLWTVAGVLYRVDDQVVATPARAVVADLDTLPWPDRSGPARLMVGVPTAYMMGSRGCLYACDYCCITTLHRLVQGKRFRQRSPEDIANEMAWLYHRRGVRQFTFHDDNFLVPSVAQNLERIDALDRAMKKRGLSHIGLVLKCRPAEVDPRVFERLRTMGLLRVFLGVESGSAAGLASIGRRQSVEDEHRALRICEELEISTQYTIILFHPEATAQTMLDDLSFVREHAAHPLSFCRAEIYAGTPLERRMIASSRASGDYLARVYDYPDPAARLAWSFAKDLLLERCFSQSNLMGQVIRLDHQAAVFRAFYEGGEVGDLCADFASLELEVNLDTVTLLEDLVRACQAHSDPASPELARRTAELRERERASRCALERRVCALRQALHDRAFSMIGLPQSPTASRSLPVGRRPENLPMHAAAVFLAIGLLRCGTESSGGYSSDAATLDATGSGGWFNQGGVMEAPPPPIGGAGGVVRFDSGVADAKTDASDSGTDAADSGSGGWFNQGGGMEAPPPPLGGNGGR